MLRSCPGIPSWATCGEGSRESWQWSEQALQCGAARQEAAALRALLAHRWFVVAGDSIGRFFFAALLRLLSDNRTLLKPAFSFSCVLAADILYFPAFSRTLLCCGAATQQIVFGHRDFEYLLPGSIKATFLWAPYGTNLTAHFKAWWESLYMCPRSTALREQGHGAEQLSAHVRGEGSAAPDAFVLSAGLWHMLHITDVRSFSLELSQLKAAAVSFLARTVQARLRLSSRLSWPHRSQAVVVYAQERRVSAQSLWVVLQAPPVSIFSISEVFPPKLKTEEKRVHLTPANVDAYNHAMAKSGVLSPSGPFHLVDIHSLTRGMAAFSCVCGLKHFTALLCRHRCLTLIKLTACIAIFQAAVQDAPTMAYITPM